MDGDFSSHRQAYEYSPRFYNKLQHESEAVREKTKT